MPRRKPESSYQRNRIARKIREDRRRRRLKKISRRKPAHVIIRETIRNRGYAMSFTRKLRVLLVEKTLLERLGYKYGILNVFRKLMSWWIKKFFYYMLYHFAWYFYVRSRRIDKYITLFKLLVDTLRGRARVLLALEYYPFHDRDIANYVVDNLVENLPPDIRQQLVDALYRILTTRMITPDILYNPALEFFIRYYVARYMPYPCRNNSIAIKVTPIIVRYLSPKLRVVTYIAFRWSFVKDLRPGLYLETPQFIDLYHGWIPRYKPEHEMLLLRDIANNGTMDPNDRVELARNFLGQPTYTARLEDLMLRPSTIRKAYQRVTNREEDRYAIHHCSILVAPMMKTPYKLKAMEEDIRAIFIVPEIKKKLKRLVVMGG